MKSLVSFLALVVFAGFITPAVFAQSVSFLRMQSRAATTGSIDAAYFNPAGLAGLKDGFHLDVGYQYLTKTTAYKIAYSNGEDSGSSWFIPNFAAAYKLGKGAIFLSLNMPEGVERIDYRKPYGGMPLISYIALDLDSLQMAALRSAGLTLNTGGMELPMVNYVQATRYWLQGRAGGSFVLGDVFAFSGGITVSYYAAERSAGLINTGTVDKIEKSAVGCSGFAGLMIGPQNKFVVSAFYAAEVIARGTEKNVKYNYTRAAEQRIPDQLSIGLNIKSADKASVQISYQVSFSGERRYGTKNLPTRSHELAYLDWLTVAQNASGWSLLPLISSGNSRNYKYRDRHSIGLGFEFEFSGIAPSIGLSYSTQEKYPRAQNPLDPDLARVGFGAGMKVTSGNLVIETGSTYYFYVTDRMFYNSTKMNRTAWAWGASISYGAL